MCVERDAILLPIGHQTIGIAPSMIAEADYV